MSARAAHVGFDWKRLEDLFDKMREEMRELASEAGNEGGGSGGAAADGESVSRAGEAEAGKDLLRFAALEDEAGDLLFTAVNVARFLKGDPESALRKTNRKFRHRFQWMERELARAGKSPREATLEEMDALWTRSKQATNDFGR